MVGAVATAEMAAVLFIVGTLSGIPNAAVAAYSNHKLLAFLDSAAWKPGRLGPGGVQRGLVYLKRSPSTPTPQATLVYRSSGVLRKLTLPHELPRPQRPEPEGKAAPAPPIEDPPQP
jgi:hypothetical protein